MGTARAFMTAADGRQLTVRYARRGVIIGKHSYLTGDHPPLALQALTDCTVLALNWVRFTAVSETEITLAAAVMMELARRLGDVFASVGDSAFGSIRERLIRHLLALASEGHVDTSFAAFITHQQLADAIGSSREVVTRELGALREQGLIRTKRGEIELIGIDRLAELLGHWRNKSPY
jgi:CRP-like cAMP-binding protein